MAERTALPVVIAAMLANKGRVLPVQRVRPNQLPFLG